MTIYEKQDIQFNNALELDRKLVGIKIFYDEKEYENERSMPLTGCLPYCTMVKAATTGSAFKAKREFFGCFGGATALGMIDPDTEKFPDKEPGYYESGQFQFYQMKLYETLEISEKSTKTIEILRKKAYGIVVKPLYLFESDPDVVIVVCNAFNAMRIIQGYSYTYGTYSNFRMAGNQALCSETTSYPIVSGNINVSMMCSGARENTHFKETEISVGIPYLKFAGTLNGLYMTINPLERDPKKKIIDAKMEATDEKRVEIEYGKNYDDGNHIFGRTRR